MANHINGNGNICVQAKIAPPSFLARRNSSVIIETCTAVGDVCIQRAHSSLCLLGHGAMGAASAPGICLPRTHISNMSVPTGRLGRRRVIGITRASSTVCYAGPVSTRHGISCCARSMLTRFGSRYSFGIGSQWVKGRPVMLSAPAYRKPWRCSTRYRA